MLALLKKSGSSDKPKELAWRVDFREVSTLPDTKTVRTNFLVNALVYGALSAVTLFFIYREINLLNLKEEIKSIDAQIIEATAASDRAIADFKLFQAEETRMKEVLAFGANKFRFTDFVVRIGTLLPPGVRTTRIDYRGNTQAVVVAGEVLGQDAQASAAATEMIATLQADGELKKTFPTIKLNNLGRNAAAGNLSFELHFEFPTAPARPAPAAR